jgi:hypothetical protein
MLVKRLRARDPFTQSDEPATSSQKGIHEIEQAGAGYNPGRIDVVF